MEFFRESIDKQLESILQNRGRNKIQHQVSQAEYNFKNKQNSYESHFHHNDWSQTVGNINNFKNKDTNPETTDRKRLSKALNQYKEALESNLDQYKESTKKALEQLKQELDAINEVGAYEEGAQDFSEQ